MQHFYFFSSFIDYIGNLHWYRNGNFISKLRRCLQNTLQIKKTWIRWYMADITSWVSIMNISISFIINVDVECNTADWFSTVDKTKTFNTPWLHKGWPNRACSTVVHHKLWRTHTVRSVRWDIQNAKFFWKVHCWDAILKRILLHSNLFQVLLCLRRKLWAFLGCICTPCTR